MGEDVSKCVLAFLNLKTSIKDINKTLICLIPKVKTADKMRDFRPISLCNTVYKVAAKVLANRLKNVMSDLVAPNQGAFVPQRLITYNIIVVFETLHSLHHRYKGKEGWYALKLDMSKAYDKVDWDFSVRFLINSSFLHLFGLLWSLLLQFSTQWFLMVIFYPLSHRNEGSDRGIPFHHIYLCS